VTTELFLAPSNLYAVLQLQLLQFFFYLITPKGLQFFIVDGAIPTDHVLNMHRIKFQLSHPTANCAPTFPAVFHALLDEIILTPAGLYGATHYTTDNNTRTSRVIVHLFACCLHDAEKIKPGHLTARARDNF